MSAVRIRTQRISDPALTKQLVRWDRIRASNLAAYRRLFAVVAADATIDEERRAGSALDKQAAALRREQQRLRNLTAPYMSDEQRKSLEVAGG